MGAENDSAFNAAPQKGGLLTSGRVTTNANANIAGLGVLIG